MAMRVLLAAAMLVGTMAMAQTPDAAPAAKAPAYDVSTIKPSKPDSTDHDSMFDGSGHYEGLNITVKGLVKTAFNMRDSLIFGLPPWALKENFDIHAKSVETDEATLKTMPIKMKLEMLRKLLEARFQLKWHVEQHEMPVYELVLAKGGSKLTPAVVTNHGGGIRGGRNGELTGINCPMTVFTMVLSDDLSRSVVDRTGLTGKYDFTLKFTPDNTPASEGADSPGIFTAMQEQLGLKLQPSKAMQDVLVIDSVSQPTAD